MECWSFHFSSIISRSADGFKTECGTVHHGHAFGMLMSVYAVQVAKCMLNAVFVCVMCYVLWYTYVRILV